MIQDLCFGSRRRAARSNARGCECLSAICYHSTLNPSVLANRTNSRLYHSRMTAFGAGQAAGRPPFSSSSVFPQDHVVLRSCVRPVLRITKHIRSIGCTTSSSIDHSVPPAQLLLRLLHAIINHSAEASVVDIALRAHRIRGLRACGKCSRRRCWRT